MNTCSELGAKPSGAVNLSAVRWSSTALSCFSDCYGNVTEWNEALTQVTGLLPMVEEIALLSGAV